jgi:hypothetical protein
METRAPQSVRQRILQRIAGFAIYFIGWIAISPMIDRLWPPPEPFLKTSDLLQLGRY